MDASHKEKDRGFCERTLRLHRELSESPYFIIMDFVLQSAVLSL